jgi:hypothetical protein
MRMPTLRAPTRRAIAHWGQILLVLVAVAAVLWRSEVQEDRVDALSAALGDEQSNAEAQGIEPIAPQPEELLEDPQYTPAPGPSGPTGPPGPPGPTLTDPQIQAAFARYFADHPYEFEPSAAELTAAFASVLADHPDLLNEQLYAAMAAYLAENPPPPGPAGADGQDGADGADGQDGAQGEPGRPPTEDEIRAQVEGYVAEHGLPLCPEGSAPEAQTVLTTNGTVDAVICVAAATE